MPEVYLITAIHADGSRRQWAGKKPKSLEDEDIDFAYGFFGDIHDPHRTPGTAYDLIPFLLLPDCALKDKAIYQ